MRKSATTATITFFFIGSLSLANCLNAADTECKKIVTCDISMDPTTQTTDPTTKIVTIKSCLVWHGTKGLNLKENDPKGFVWLGDKCARWFVITSKPKDRGHFTDDWCGGPAASDIPCPNGGF